jgi:GntR family transcriptional repressor for pyruvate dehydrogenase complex
MNEQRNDSPVLDSSPRIQLHQPRLAEMVAGLLRERILSGALRDGDALPRQEDLLKEFGISKPSLREALRILEAEGLITVRRGNRGGAIVHVPEARNAAYMIDLVLKVQNVGLDDVGGALAQLEPLCATLCAQREDRVETVLPQLREAHEAAVAALDDALEFTERSRRFHELLVELCGNQTLILLVGALEAIWADQEREWAQRATQSGGFPERERRRQGMRAHEKLLDLIEAGDHVAVNEAARVHLHAIQRYALSADGESATLT